MKDDPLRRDIERELRALRPQPGVLDLSRVAASETLTDFVGRGSPERALAILEDTFQRFGTNPLEDIGAFFATCGEGLEGTNLDERLKDYARQQFVTERTALRRSDRGANKLSYILRDSLRLERPWGAILISEVGGLAVVEVRVDVPHESQWRRPHVYIDKVQKDCVFELHDSKRSDFFATASESFLNVPITLTGVPGTDLLEVEVFWVMPVWPIWAISAGFSTPGLSVTHITERNSGATVTVWEGRPT
jgi:hypothetical protein